MSTSKTTECPQCGFEIDVNDLLHKEIEAKFQKELTAERSKLKAQQAAVLEQQQAFEQKVREQVATSVAKEKSALEAQLRTQLEADQIGLIDGLKQQLADQSKKLADLTKAQLEIERLKNKQATLRGEIELDLEKQFAQKLRTEAEALREKAHEQFNLQVREKEHVINQLKEQLHIAQRKADQGSMQIQGEVQELVLEDWLRSEYPADQIEEIKKGQQGGDTVQVVNGALGTPSGTIYYESKRTKAFQPAWIAKFKEDILNRSADVGVLVTQTLPEGVQQVTQIDGVWVCSFSQVKALSRVLRESLIQINNALAVTANKGDKMGMLYDFLTGNEFRMQIEAIVEGFVELKDELEREKRAMQGTWKRREKQLDRVLLNTNSMYNSVRGIAGSAVKAIESLEHLSNED